MDHQQHPHEHPFKLLTTPTPPQPHPHPHPHPHPLAHLPPNNNNNSSSNSQQDRRDLGLIDDKKNGVVLHLPPTPYAVDHHQPRTSETATCFKPLVVSDPPSSGPGGAVRYRECLKNHAASMGTNVVDGCGEFMPSGKEGTSEALKCAACQCHRNFHRRDLHDSPFPCRSLVLHLPPPPHHHHHQIVQPMTVAYGGGANSESSSDDDLAVQVFDEMPQRGRQFVEAAGSTNRKRFRTKFTREQKDKMLEFAEKLGWRLQRQDDEMVERFCNEVGVRRQVLKVWMHNNKNSFKKPNFIPDHQDPPPQPDQHPQIHQLLHLHHQHQQQQQQQSSTL